MGKSKTNKQFLDELQFKYGNEYVPLDLYKKGDSKMAFFHIDCGTIEYHTPHHLLSGHGCKKCGNLKISCLKQKNDNDFSEKLKTINNSNEFVFNDSYKGSKVKISCTHIICGYTWDITPDSFYLNHGCPECSSKRISELNSLSVNAVLKRLPSSIKLLDTYRVGELNKHYHLMCNKCGYGKDNEWFPNLLDVLDKGSRCPSCNLKHRSSKGESLILKILNDLGYINGDDFLYGYVTLSGLHLDFYFPKLKRAIEYDGIQHYEPREVFGGLKAFKLQQERDKRKNKQMKLFNINLLRVSYKYDTYNKIYNKIFPFVM